MRLFHRGRSTALSIVTPVLMASTSSCSNAGSFVWVSQLPPEVAASSDSSVVIRDGDTVSIRVFSQEALSTRAKVRSDGRIAMPVLGDIEVRGRRPSAIREELEKRLKDYVNAPSVTVSLDEVQPITVSVLGEVTKAGTFPLDPRATVAQALASAGGLTDFATKDRIFVVRARNTRLRVRFTYEDISRGDTASARFVLQDGDLVVVE
jgi:polysaccharide export outer membrane protein